MISVGRSAVTSPPTVGLLEASLHRQEPEWQRLCDKFLLVSASRIQCGDTAVSKTQRSDSRLEHLCLPPYLARRDARFNAPELLAELRKVDAGTFYGFSS
jgi:hypothetical protein